MNTVYQAWLFARMVPWRRLCRPSDVAFWTVAPWWHTRDE